MSGGADREGVRLTAEQRAALAASGVSVALGAGAGCGKTSVLTERFLAFLEGPPRRPLSRFVALTFTDRAARELRDRVRQACRRRLEAEGSDHLDDAEVAHWRGVLRGLEAAPIGTFHAFCARLLRRFAAEAGLDPGFRVLEEAIAPTLRDEALAACVRDWLADGDPDLTALAIEFGLFAVRRSLADLIVHRASGDLRDWAGRDPVELVAIWERAWTDRLPEVLGRFVDEARPCLELLRENPCTHPRMADRRAFLLEQVPALPNRGDPEAALEAIREMAKVQGGGKKTDWPSEEVFEAVKVHLKGLRDAIDKLLEQFEYDPVATRSAAEHGLRFARLAIGAIEAYERRKRARGCLDFDDLLRKLRDLLRSRAEAVRAELLGSIDVLLVDEFQDTDPIQGEVLRLLAGPDAGDGRLFLVGDDKQSIYRFRGAQPRIFRDFRAEFPEGGRLALTENFRSVPGILDFVNALFAATFPGERLRPGPTAPPRVDEPAVEFLWAVEPDPAGTPPDARARRVVEARWIARRLAARLADGWEVRDRATGLPRPAHAGDVAILFRSLTDATSYEKALVLEGLEYYVVGGVAFYAQQEVHDLVNLLSAIEDPLDAVSLAGALRSPAFAVSDEAIYAIAAEAGPTPDLVAGFEGGAEIASPSGPDRDRVARARKLLAAWRAAKDRLTIAGLIDRVLDESGYEASLIGEFLGPRKRANVRKLVRLARRFDLQGGFTLADFVARLRADLKDPPKEEQAATTDEEGESVRLMTIHQAKGLEFPIVVVPDLDRASRADASQVAFHPDLGPIVRPARDADPSLDDPDADGPGRSLGHSLYRRIEQLEDEREALRLLYVATTRARDFLILSAPLAADDKLSSPALKLLASRFDRATGRVLASLAADCPEPVVRVLDQPPPPLADRPAARRRPRLARVARLIRKADRSESGDPSANPADDRTSPLRPRFIDLDPALHLAPVAALVDRLIRAILADPQAFDPKSLPRVAARVTRALDPTPPPPIIAEALDRLMPWIGSPIALAIDRSRSVQRAIPWSIAWPPDDPAATVFRGVLDFLALGRDDDWHLVHVADPTAPEPLERLRLLLSARVAAAAGAAPIARAWTVLLGPGGRSLGAEAFDDAAVDAAVHLDLSWIRGTRARRIGDANKAQAD